MNNHLLEKCIVYAKQQVSFAFPLQFCIFGYVAKLVPDVSSITCFIPIFLLYSRRSSRVAAQVEFHIASLGVKPVEKRGAAALLASKDSFKYLVADVFFMKAKRHSREKLAKEIREAMKDPEMRKGIREFIKATS